MDPFENDSAVSELRVPLKEERVAVEKKRVSAGEVRIHKRVVTEPRRLTARVTEETVHVERLGGHELPAGFRDDARAFVEETIVIPLRREEVELHKRVVVREEVVIARTAHVEEREVEAEARREELSVERDAPTHH